MSDRIEHARGAVFPRTSTRWPEHSRGLGLTTRTAFRLATGIGGLALLLASVSGSESLDWTRLPALPDSEGFAGPFGGTYRGALVVAGGANFPGKKPWQGGAKVWHDKVFVLNTQTARWRVAGRLPRPLGYGVSASAPGGIVCAGGSDSKQHFAEVFLLRLTNDAPQFTALPPLPHACANASGVLLNGQLFVAGGTARPDSTKALTTFWSLDLSQAGASWRQLEPWPGPGRMFAIVAAARGSVFLFGGAALEPGPDGKPNRRWLRDAYQFTPDIGWKRLPDLPRVAVAAPSPAPRFADHLLLLGGDDGAQANAAPAEHRGFRRDVLSYDLNASTWSTGGETPFALVTTSAIEWNGRIVILGSETRPGIRSTEVWSAPLGSR